MLCLLTYVEKKSQYKESHPLNFIAQAQQTRSSVGLFLSVIFLHRKKFIYQKLLYRRNRKKGKNVFGEKKKKKASSKNTYKVTISKIRVSATLVIFREVPCFLIRKSSKCYAGDFRRDVCWFSEHTSKRVNQMYMWCENKSVLLLCEAWQHGRVVKALDSKSSGFSRVGSNPTAVASAICM